MTDQATTPRLAVSPLEAAHALGISRSTLYASGILDEIAVLHIGTRTLVPISELEKYIQRNARRNQGA